MRCRVKTVFEFARFVESYDLYVCKYERVLSSGFFERRVRSWPHGSTRKCRSNACRNKIDCARSIRVFHQHMKWARAYIYICVSVCVCVCKRLKYCIVINGVVLGERIFIRRPVCLNNASGKRRVKITRPSSVCGGAAGKQKSAASHVRVCAHVYDDVVHRV